MRVLIADDEALIRMGLRSMLRDMGHTVVGAASDGRTALRMACDTLPDLAILDIKMPEMDGLAVAQAIAERCALPVVMLTAYSERDLVQRAAATETVQAYLVKPLREAELGPAIEVAVATTHGGRHQLGRLLRIDFPKSQTDSRHRLAVVQPKRRTGDRCIFHFVSVHSGRVWLNFSAEYVWKTGSSRSPKICA